MNNILKITGSNGTQFIVRRINTDKTTVLIEFYDARYNFTPYGQFISRYYAATLKSHNGNLNLHGGVPEWQVDAANMGKVVAWI